MKPKIASTAVKKSERGHFAAGSAKDGRDLSLHLIINSGE